MQHNSTWSSSPLFCAVFVFLTFPHERSFLFPSWQQCSQWSKIDECLDGCLTGMSLNVLDNHWDNAPRRIRNDLTWAIWKYCQVVFCKRKSVNRCSTPVEHILNIWSFCVHFWWKSLFKKGGWEQEIQRRIEGKEEKCMKSISREKSISKGKSRSNSNRCWTGVEHMMNKERKGKERK